MPYSLIDTALNATWWLSTIMFVCFLGLMLVILLDDLNDPDDPDA